VTLAELKTHSSGALQGMALFTRPRLSVQPVTQQEWDFILGLEQEQEQEKPAKA
jgi:predicted RNA-binding protein with PUA-like domain